VTDLVDPRAAVPNFGDVGLRVARSIRIREKGFRTYLKEVSMEDLILGLFIGIPVALVIAAIIAYARSNREIQLDSAETEEV
jgi:hypothetical protein